MPVKKKVRLSTPAIVSLFLLIVFPMSVFSVEERGWMHLALAASVITMLIAALMRPFSWFFLSLTLFFFLGVWLKVSLHSIFNYTYVEPIGNFNSSNEQWDEFYYVAIGISLALVVSKIAIGSLMPLISKTDSGGKLSSYPSMSTGLPAPVTFREWAVIVGAGILLYWTNSVYSLFVIGVNAGLELPLSLNAPFSFMVLIGYVIVLSVYIERDCVERRCLSTSAVIVVIITVLLSSISMASRAVVLIHVVPIIVGILSLSKKGLIDNSATAKRIIIVMGLVVVIPIAVTLCRAQLYPDYYAGETEYGERMLRENLLLPLDRWIGAESIMVAVGEMSKSPEVFVSLLSENPREGVNSIYQVASGRPYAYLDSHTFLTLPGYYGIVALSGSMFVVCISVFMIGILGMLLEELYRFFLSGMTIPLAVAALSLANAFAQMSFPWLLIPFVLQMTALLSLIWIFRKPRHVGLAPSNYGTSGTR